MINSVVQSVVKSVVSGVVAGGGSASATPTPGFIGLWYAADYTTSPTPNVPNLAAPGASDPNLLRGSYRILNQYFLHGGTLTPNGFADPIGGLTAGRFEGSAGGQVVNQCTLAAGQVTLSVWVQSNTGVSQSFKMSPSESGVAQVTKVATTMPQLFSVTGTIIAGDHTVMVCNPPTVGDSLDLLIWRPTLLPGTAVPSITPPTLTGEMLLGRTPYGTDVPAFDGESLDFNAANGQAVIQFDEFTECKDATVIFAAKRLGEASGLQGILTTVPSVSGEAWPDFVAGFLDVPPRPSGYFRGGNIGMNAGMNPGNDDAEFRFVTVSKSGSTAEIWIDDVLMASASTTSTSNPLRDFSVGRINGVGQLEAKLAAVALYPRGLTSQERSDTIAAMRARIAIVGTVTTPIERWWLSEGDSLSHPGSWPDQTVALMTTGKLFGRNLAQGGSVVATLVSRASGVDASLPSSLIGRRPILTVMIGTNDLGPLSVSDYLDQLSSYLDARRAAGWYVILFTILPSEGIGFNAKRNNANTTLRTWVGTHCDQICDTAADPDIGQDSDSADTDKYYDGTHPTPYTRDIIAQLAAEALDIVP